MEGRGAIRVGSAQVDVLGQQGMNGPFIRILHRVHQPDIGTRGQQTRGQYHGSNPYSSEVCHGCLFLILTVPGHTDNSSSTLPLLSAKLSRWIPTLSSRVR